MGAPFLPYGRQQIDADDIAAVVAALQGDLLTTGPAVAAFEEALCAQLGARHAVACANGTAALHLAYLAQGLGPGDRVIVPAITFLATANAARMCDAEVVFADVDPDNGLMTPATLDAAIASAGAPVKLAIPVHLAGQPCDLISLGAIATEHGARLVEDACHALGTRYGNGQRVGDCATSAAACFSFHPVKTIAMGEGGAVTTNDPEVAARMRRLRHHGMASAPGHFAYPAHGLAADGKANPWYYEMPELGYNYRASDLQCALGLSQLAKLDRFAETRRHLVRRYEARLSVMAPRIRFIARAPHADPCWHLAVALIDFAALGRDRRAVMAALRDQAIGSQVHYFPVSHQPYYVARYGAPDLPGAWRYYERCLSLPLHAGMKDADVDRVCDALEGLLP
ncbi:MAG: UDP-4-amino-4,6-dideoxy-N-acetyl-beta-L-altrosamine transaminase [Pseudomonadota bacterium]